LLQNYKKADKEFTDWSKWREKQIFCSKSTQWRCAEAV